VHVVGEAKNGFIRRVLMKKKMLSIILTAAMLAGTLAGCCRG